jgi:type III pantothenate kinase
LITLCLDFGNTRQKCAVFDRDVLKEILIVENSAIDSIWDLIRDYSPTKTILASVIDHNPEIEKLLSHNSRFHKLGLSSKLPFSTPVNKPETIGSDRLALAAGAVTFYPSKNNLVIGLGSCITYNFINKYNEFLGGGISLGAEMRFRALNTFTAKLPLVKPEFDIPLIGYDTKSNILSGVVLGMANEIDGIIDSYKERFSNFNVLLTGGDAPYFAPHLKNKIFADFELIFKGLYAISNYNDDIKT